MKKIVLLVLVLMTLTACGGGEEESELEARVIELEKQLDIMLLGLQADYGKKVSIDTPPIQIEKNQKQISEIWKTTNKIAECQYSMRVAFGNLQYNIYSNLSSCY
tara:strand:+ start:114 stop:428 length:315 start_codon:yes stop_codon:yes gene_type:complete